MEKLGFRLYKGYILTGKTDHNKKGVLNKEGNLREQ